MITEGLLLYLPASTVEALAADSQSEYYGTGSAFTEAARSLAPRQLVLVIQHIREVDFNPL
jgi:hypothetical protein